MIRQENKFRGKFGELWILTGIAESGVRPCGGTGEFSWYPFEPFATGMTVLTDVRGDVFSDGQFVLAGLFSGTGLHKNNV